MSRPNYENLTPGAVLCVVGARPNFMKIAPIMSALSETPGIPAPGLVHTGQHYDAEMNESFFAQLGIPQPDVDLGVGSGSHAVQTAEIMRRFEPVVDAVAPAAVVVVGDVNSTIACALVAVKKGVPVVHVEAGLRSFDRSMPEEINRLLTDQISDLLFITEQSGRENLLREGVEAGKIHLVGNVMIDTVLRNKARAVPARQTLARLAGETGPPSVGEYALVTLHRPSNVDRRSTLEGLVATLGEVARRIPVVFPVHPRTRKALEEGGLDLPLKQSPGVLLSGPLGYLETLGLMLDARMLLTDSGGMQEEATALGLACLTLRENTERPITVLEGTNTLVGTDRAKILEIVDELLSGGGKSGRVPDLWDGKAARRIAQTMAQWLMRRETKPV